MCDQIKKIESTRYYDKDYCIVGCINIQMKPKSGITSMPIHIQKMLIRTSYYPTPDKNEEILVYLLQNGATKQTLSIQMDSSTILDELVTAEHVIKKEGRYYLSNMGTITAKGAISLYPELIQ